MSRVGAAPPPGRGGIARRLRAELGSPPERDEWPPVSIVVVNRDGREQLELLLRRLADATDYPELELVLVDNASSDGSVDLARGIDLPFPVVAIENDDNLPFGDANADGVERTRFDLVLLLNNDVEPFDPGWLKELVDCLEREDAAAVGATLLHGAKHRDRSGSGYVLQHRGIELVREAGLVVPFNSGDGEELQPFEAADVPRPACTAACLLVRREVFRDVGGFTPGFLWGWEDVDLGFKLTAAGYRIVCSGRGVLFHNESSTRSQIGGDWSRRTRAHNQRLFMERWGPQSRREYLLDRIAGGGFWADRRPPRLAVILSGDPSRDLPVRELADAIEGEGWRVGTIAPQGSGWERLPSDLDAVVVTDPGFAASVPRGLDCLAWVGEPVDDWLASPLLHRSEITLAGHPSVEAALERAGVGAIRFPGAVSHERLERSSTVGAPELDCLVVADREEIAPEWAIALERCADLRVRVAGAGWDGDPAFGFESLRATDSQPASLAAPARIVVHQAPVDGSRGPAEASVVLEALVVGALPLSDDVALVDGLFGDGELPTWSSADELELLLRDLIADDSRRQALVERGVSLLPDEHTWPLRARRLLGALRERAERRRFCLKLSELPGAEPAALPLRRALERAGHACAIQLRDEWESLDGLTADVVVAFGDPGEYATKPAQFNVLHTTSEAVRPTQCDQWDLVLVPDAEGAERLAAQTPTQVAAVDLAGASDPAAELIARIDQSPVWSEIRPRVVAHA